MSASPPMVDWLFLDLNSYFASVEQQECPDLRGEPIAIVPMPTDATCAIAASYEAKAYGIKTGTKIYDAKRMCPRLKCVLARHDIYVDYHDCILSEFSRHAPITKVWSIDEWSCKLPPNKRPLPEAIALAKRIKQGIWDNVGKHINCSIGLAGSGLLAKIATDIEKPDGLVALPTETLPGRLTELKLSDIPGIGINMEKRLNRAGIWTVEQFWHTSPKQARKLWGSVGGERFWYQLHGHEIPEQKTNTSMVGHSRMLDPDLRIPEKAKGIAKRLTIKAAQRLRRKGFYATRFSLSVRTTDKRHWAQEIHDQPVDDSVTFLHYLDRLWSAMMCELHPYLLLKVSITMYGLKKPSEISYDLFEHAFSAVQEQKKHHTALSNTIESLNKRFGMDTINFGVPPKTIAGYVGTKIAFSRVPDKEEFRE